MRKTYVPMALGIAILLSSCSLPSNQSGQASGKPQSIDATPTTTPTQKKIVHPVSLPGLMEHDTVGSNLRLGKVLRKTANYTRYAVTYDSNEFTISGVMNIPKGDGPFPTLVLGHGYIDPKVYTSGRGLIREQHYLANRGFIVLHTDYRNHAGSDDDSNNALNMRLGYTLDVIAAARALRNSGLPEVDVARIGYLGRSMGGGIGYNVATVAPNEFDAIVLYAPVSANYVDNYNRWGRGNPDIEPLITTAYGSPEDSPEFWADLSAENFFERISDPIMIHHGTNDIICKLEWSKRAVSQMKSLNKDVTLHIYKGEKHAFEPQLNKSLDRSIAFFDEHL